MSCCRDVRADERDSDSSVVVIMAMKRAQSHSWRSVVVVVGREHEVIFGGRRVGEVIGDVIKRCGEAVDERRRETRREVVNEG